MTAHGIECVLAFTLDEAGEARQVMESLICDSQAVSARLDDLDRRVATLAATLDIDRQPQEHTPRTRIHRIPEPVEWPDLQTLALRRMNETGIDPDSISLDELIGPARSERLDRIHGTIRIRSRLDPYDIAAAITAGAIGTLVDCLVVKIPTGGKWHGEWQSGSLLTFGLRRHAVPADNWLSGLVRVPFDRVEGVPIRGLGPRSHRVQTFGHDPLFGLVFGTTDILRGTLTGADPDGRIQVVQTGPERTEHLLVALALEVAHLLSDVVTRMGLPLPGWSLLTAIPAGSVGPHQSVAELARWMYLRGYGTWHFLTMASSPAAVEMALRAYVGLRRLSDGTYDSMWTAEAESHGARRIETHPRYQLLSLVAHGVAALGNVGKLAYLGGNPLAVNYDQWLVVIRRLIDAVRPLARTDAVTSTGRFNQVTLDAGWARLGIAVE